MAEAFTPRFVRPDSALDVDSPSIGQQQTPAPADDIPTNIGIDDGEETDTDDERPKLIPEKQSLNGRKVDNEAVIAVDDEFVACTQNGPVLVAHDGTSKIIVNSILPTKVITFSLQLYHQ